MSRRFDTELCGGVAGMPVAESAAWRKEGDLTPPKKGRSVARTMVTAAALTLTVATAGLYGYGRLTQPPKPRYNDKIEQQLGEAMRPALDKYGRMIVAPLPWLTPTKRERG